MKGEADGFSGFGQSSSSDGDDDTSSDGYDSSSSCCDTRYIPKRSKRKCSCLHCTCFCIMRQGHEKRVHNATSMQCKGMRDHNGLHHLRCNAKRKCARHESLEIEAKMRGHLSKHRAKRKICNRQQLFECSLMKARDLCYHDFLGLEKARQGKSQSIEDVHNNRKRQSNYTEESTSKRRKIPDLNLKCPSDESLTSKLDLLGKDGCSNGTTKEEQTLEESKPDIDKKVVTQTSAKTDEKSMLEAPKVSTPRSCILQGQSLSPEKPVKKLGNTITRTMEMEVQGKNEEVLNSLEVSAKITEKSGLKTRKKRAVRKTSLTEVNPKLLVEFEHAINASGSQQPDASIEIVISINTDLSGVEETITKSVPQQYAFVGLCSEESIALVEGMIAETGPLKMAMSFEPQRWDPHIVCDLCHRGPSLSLGEWYCSCCGSCLQNCNCGVRSSSEGGNEYSCSGKVHKMCALWSIKVFSKNKILEGLSDLVKCGKLLKCARCQMEGATLGCHEAKCTQVFHYPCADALASKLRCRMWCGPQFSVACHKHQLEMHSKEGSPTSTKVLKKAQQKLGIGNTSSCPMSEEPGAAEHKDECKNIVDTIIQISSDNDVPKINCKTSLGQPSACILHNLNERYSSDKNLPMDENIALFRYGGVRKTFYYFGNNLLCDDISGGCEAMLIPCTNDVDTATIPHIKYTTRSRHIARTKRTLNSLRLNKQNLALPCKGCNAAEIDDPHGQISPHLLLINGQRHGDARIDWQGQPMFGRLPYDQYGRLQVGDEMDIVECSYRCPCGFTCVNKELQKGLKLHLEVFRTETHEWAVRTTEAIPRGRFVVEFSGEILTHDEAHKRRGEYNMSELRQGHLDEYVEELLVIDWYRMSNVAQFIRRSPKGNLKMHRVYTEIKDPHFYRIGLYASRDVEIGEELSYEGTKCFNCKHTTINFPFATVRNVDRLMNSAELL